MAISQTLSNYFLNPVGLAALSAIIPLVIFYLVRKKPEEQVMPAMMFFMKDKKSGKAQRALKTLLRNWLLLFHILIIAGLAAALAHPYFDAPATSDHSVLVLDSSASMADNLGDAKSFLRENNGQENTLIVAGEEVDVPVEKASDTRLRSALRSVDAEDTRTDIVSAIELAADYEGDITVASDLDQTVNQRSAVELVESLRTEGRNVRVMDIEEKNSWGIVDVKPDEKNSSVDIKNFQEQDTELEITASGSTKVAEIDAGSVKTFTFAMSPGKNTISLENDPVEVDNTAYISVPEKKSSEIVLISDSGNRYFEKAVELVPFTEITVMTPPLDSVPEADVYAIGTTNRVLSGTIETIEEKVRNGKSMIVFSHTGTSELGFESLPVTPQNSLKNATVTVEKPVKTSFDTQILAGKKTSGESYANPANALVRTDYGRGEVFYYNVRDDDFNKRFIYPVFWKKVLQELTDQPSINQLNVRTGQEINASGIETPSGKTVEGELRVKDAGYYNTSEGVYAANLESMDESFAEETGEFKASSSIATEERDVQNLATLLIAGLLIVELAYLAHLGEV